MHVRPYWAVLSLRERETSGKGTWCVSALSPLESKGLSEAVTQGAPFLGSPYAECFKVNCSALACQQLTRQKGLVGDSKQFMQPLERCETHAIPFLQAHITCSLLLLSGVSVVVVPCPWKVLPWHCANMSQCYFWLLMVKMTVQVFLKQPTSKSLKSKHRVVM